MLLREHVGAGINGRPLEKYASKHGLLQPKCMGKAAWRLMMKAMLREVARFIESRLGELKISEARYEDLLGEADHYYPEYLKLLSQQVHE